MYAIILCLIFLVVLLILLPSINGLVNYSKPVGRPAEPSSEEEPEQSEYSGYIPPDELIAEKPKAKTSGTKLNITRDDVPQMKIRGLHKRGINSQKIAVKDIREVQDPNNYDYDLDSLIKEEIDEDVKEQNKAFLTKLNTGVDYDSMA